ncbi:MAG: LysR family transcriptional regulator [Alphaproteobacteria bacterium]|nr:LysR family transcriptional regulator [Alphaproteobacteria bacterium]
MQREDLTDLSLFLAVVDEGGFTRAAKKLGLSQSALSHALRRLEKRLGVRLLVRTTRSVAPTEPGERLLETLRPALSNISHKLASLADLREEPAGLIRITTSQHAARTVLWPAVDRLTTMHPGIRVELHVDSGLADIVADRFDAGVRLGERLERDMVAVPIGPKLRMAAVCAPSYLAKRGTPKRPHDLAQHACINLRLTSAGGLYAWEFDKAGRALKVKVDGQLIFNDLELILQAAVAGHGIAFMIEDHATRYLADQSLVRVLEDWCEPFDGYYLYYPKRQQPSAAFKLLISALQYQG